MIRTMATPSELWFMRKQFATQLSASIFAAYVMCGTSRVPSRFHISRSTGLIYCSEFLPGKSFGIAVVFLTCSRLRLCLAFNASIPVFASPEAVPFRLTPNMQHFLTPIGVEGILTAGVMSIGRCLTEPEVCLDLQACIPFLSSGLAVRSGSSTQSLPARRSLHLV
jgi:transformation/transcription domain-associated protein